MLLSVWDPATVLSALAIALMLDALFGDPAWLWRRTSHPVAWAGVVIGWCDRLLNRGDSGPVQQYAAGAAMIGVVLALAILAGHGLSNFLALNPNGWWLEGFCVAILLSQRGLYLHVRAVSRAFAAGGIDDAREAVAHIVGRDPARLDQAGICRAAIESLAENHSDGVIAPVFWYLLFGLPGLFAYKMLNTADSMVGYRDARHRQFGWAAARLDDVANYLPARIDAVLIAVAAVVMPTRRPRAGPVMAWRAAWNDARRHRSVNAGWPEAAMAGALGLALAGPRVYDSAVVDDAWMNRDGATDAEPADIDRALRLYVAATGLLWAPVLAALLIVPGPA
ncbi:MAG: cobalamin biosynthesis protein [Alphaproteobacteria bacterium]|nr:cobalamin biosynthesis protein [Alphaproteobacteria bacterium]